MPPIAAVPDVLAAAAAEIATAHGTVLTNALRLLKKVLGNVAANPAEPKYRSLKLSNAIVQEQLLQCPGALGLLQAVGFARSGETIALPPTTAPIAALVALALRAVTNVEARRVRWQPRGAAGAAETALLLGGAADGTPLHVGRAALDGGMQPGAARANDGGFSLGYGGEERHAAEYEVLCCAGGLAAAVRLVAAEGGAVPPGALAVGWERDGTPLYSALVVTATSVVPAKVRPGLGGAAYGEGGGEKQAQQYKVLCLAPGAVLDCPPAAPRPPARRFLVSVAELLNWKPAGIDGVSLDLRRTAPLSLPDGVGRMALAGVRPRVLHCHDMGGGYNDDADDRYLRAFTSWDMLDEFVYFGHHRICIPPPQWIEACHANAVPCLATIITEHEGGSLENTLLLDNAELASQRLAQLLSHYGFDGYLVNIEAPLPGGASDVRRLTAFLGTLRSACRKACATARVLVYDSISATGAVTWSNELTAQNKALFDACDGIFLNYWWGPQHLRRSRQLAAERRIDVYAGVDVFARGELAYTEGPGCGAGVGLVADFGLSLALFAAGWSLENGGGRALSAEDAAPHDAQFWEALGTQRVRDAK